MSTMNVSLPDELKSFVDERVGHGGFGSTSEYVRDLIRRDRERERLRWNLLAVDFHDRCGNLQRARLFGSQHVLVNDPALDDLLPSPVDDANT